MGNLVEQHPRLGPRPLEDHELTSIHLKQRKPEVTIPCNDILCSVELVLQNASNIAQMHPTTCLTKTLVQLLS